MNKQNIKVEIIKIIEKIYLKGCSKKVPNINDKTQLINDLGLDSLEILMLITALEKKFNFKIPDDDLRIELFVYLESIVDYIYKKLNKKDWYNI